MKYPELFEFLFEWSPVEAIGRSFGPLFVFDGTFNRLMISANCRKDRRTFTELGAIWELADQSEQAFRSAQFGKPEIELLRSWTATRKIVLFHQAANHRLVLVALSFLGQNQVWKGKEFDRFTLHLDRYAASPERLEWRDPAQVGHEVYAE